jgi:hypothetical protein
VHNRSLPIFGLVALALGVLASSHVLAQHPDKVWKADILWHAAKKNR